MQSHRFRVQGMHCASCATIITKTLSKLPGIQDVSVQQTTEQARVAFTDTPLSEQTLNQALAPLGYSLESLDTPTQPQQTPKHDHAALLREQLVFALPITLLVFAIMTWDVLARLTSSVPNLPLPMAFVDGMSFLLATVMLAWMGRPFLQAVTRFIKHGAANMDTLIGIGTITAYGYSAGIRLFPEIRQALNLPAYTYFDVTIVVIGFVIFGKYLEARAKQKTGTAIEKLMALQAKHALVWRDGAEQTIPLEELRLTDILIIKPGTSIPTDGVILEGSSAINESMITGESLPIDKTVGDTVIGGTMNTYGSLRCQPTRLGNDTLLAHIIQTVQDAQDSKAPIQSFADRASSVFVPIVLAIAVIALVAWLSIGTITLGFSTALSYGLLSFVSVLIIACPCALGLATPTAMTVGIGKAAERGILLKTTEAIETLSHVHAIVFDKTGTLTQGTPRVTDILPLEASIKESEILVLAASIEALSEHPLATALVDQAKERSLTLLPVKNFEALPGVGVQGSIEQARLGVRKPQQTDTHPSLSTWQSEGKTVVIVERDGAVLGMIAFADTIKAEAREAIQSLQDRGITTIMLTGDNERAAKTIAKQAGISEVVANVLPAEKAQKIQELQARYGRVAMVGDGINDAPALTQADVGIAMATGTDIAIEAADIILLRGDILKMRDAVLLTRRTMRIVRQNLFWACIYNGVGIPLAAGVFYPLWGVLLHPVFAGVAMALSSVSVVMNALRLRLR